MAFPNGLQTLKKALLNTKYVELVNELSLGRYFTFKEADRLPIYRWFHYKEGFSPQLVHWFLERYAKKAELVLDPFMGSGTTLLAADEECKKAIGLDVSPLSVFVSEVKTRSYEDEDGAKLLEYVKAAKLAYKEPSKAEMGAWKFELFPPKKAFPRKNAEKLLFLRRWLESIEEQRIRDLFLLAVLSIVPLTSLVIKDGGVLKISKRKHAMDVFSALKRAAKRMSVDIKKAGKRCAEQRAELGDARAMPLADKTVDAIITSPPYLNNVDYSKIYGLELSLLYLDERVTSLVRKRLFPSFICIKGSFGQYKEMAANAYFTATQQVWKEFYRVLTPKAVVAYNVSNAVINAEHIAVDEHVAEMAESLSFEDVKIVVGLVRKTRIKGKTYRVRESVVLAKKP